MENLTLKIVITGIIFFLMLVTGVVLSRKGRPYQKGIVAVHKILSLITIALLCWLVLPIFKDSGWSGRITGISGVSIFLFIVLIASGAMLSGEKEMPAAIKITHRISSLLLIVATAGLGFLILA